MTKITGIYVVRIDSNMDTIITTIPRRNVIPKKLRVVAYARVSSGKDTMLHSLEAQRDYYSSYISKNSKWTFSGIYSDEAISGTKDDRKGFNSLLNDARNGGIDLIITKSVSRFARNVVTLLKTIRELTSLGVDIYFEEQNIHTLSSEGEFLLTVIALYAEMEAKSVSENMLWRIQKTFQEGKVYAMKILGYRLKDGHLVIKEDEAKIVRLIYKLYLEGYGKNKIADILNEQGYKTRQNNNFAPVSVLEILKNIIYTGDIVLQKTIRLSYLSKKKKLNVGERDRYYVEDAHEAIIDKAIFNKVQQELVRRQLEHPQKDKVKHTFTMMIRCCNCGCHFIRKKRRDKYIWVCSTANGLGKSHCHIKGISEDILINLVQEVLGLNEFDEQIMRSLIQEILINENNTVKFKFYGGEEIIKSWSYPSRKESWSKEMKEKARMRGIATYRRMTNG